MKEITVQELKTKMDNGEDFQLIDVREDKERNFTHIGGDHIVMASVANHINKISKDKQVVVYCRSGARSGQVVNFLEANHGFTNLYNLKGGILAWAGEIDDTIKKY
ncbi:MAG: rhodanese-like domain-containing protein [Cyclobacteriaceae bacterium]|nr:rhodanese-like domain-containing protein [Cyclobacteriaceae bacterium]